MLTRRHTLRTILGAGAAACFVPAWNESVEAAGTITCVPSTPTVTEGPYWVDEKLFRSDIRTDPANGVARAGVPLTLTINVQNLSGSACSVVQGAYVDIWHCDAKGIYSDEPTYNPGGGTGNVNTSGQKFLRGYQITDSNGQVKFTTIYPGWYAGRTIHIHVRVRTYSGATILSNFVSQVFFDDTVSNTVLATSSYSRTSARDTTNTNDMVYQTANKERMLATLSGDLTSGYQAVITIGAALQAPAASPPVIAAGGVANAASGIAGVAPGSWISIYGSNLASTTRTMSAGDIVNNAIPTALDNVSVQIGGKPAYVYYVSPAQVNVLSPADTGAGAVAITVTNGTAGSNSTTAILQTFLPGLFVLANYVRAVRPSDATIINGTGAAETGYASAAAAKAGDVLELFATGLGPAGYTGDPGAIFTGAFATSNTVTVTIDAMNAPVSFAGLVGPGLYQINITVPAGLPSGDHAVIVSVSGVPSTGKALLKT